MKGIDCVLREAGLHLEAKPLEGCDTELDLAREALADLRRGEVTVEGQEGAEPVRFLDLVHPDRDLQPVALLERIEDWGERLRQNREVETLLYVGFGGSALGPRLLAEAFEGRAAPGAPEVLVLDTIDPGVIAGLLDRLDLDRTHLVFCSRTGGTYEVVALYRIFSHTWNARGIDLAGRLTFVTGLRGHLRAEAERLGLDVFPVPVGVGGRWSVLSPVGLTIASALGVSLEGLLAGGRVADRAEEEAAGLAVRIARAGLIVPFVYDDRLCTLGGWIGQLVMESLGKGKRRDGGASVGSPAVLPARGTADQHSVLQDLAEGPIDRLPIFIDVGETGRAPVEIPPLPGTSEGAPPLPAGVTLEQLREAFEWATRESLQAKGRDVLRLHLERIDGESIGAMLVLFEMAVAMAAGILGVDAFDQPGVEAPKRAVRSFFSRSTPETS